MNLRNTCPDHIRTKKEIYILHKEGSLLGWLRLFLHCGIIVTPLHYHNTQAYTLDAVHKYFTI